MAKAVRAEVAATLAAVAAGTVPLVYWRLDASGVVPVALRDHGVALSCSALGAIVFALWLALRGEGVRRSRRMLVIALAVVATALSGVACWRELDDYRLPESSASAGVGASLPDASFLDETGRAFPLSTLHGVPTLFVWFRGVWCPACRKQLINLARAARDYQGVRIIAVTYDPPEALAQLKRETGLPFPLLSDPQGVLMARCELMHCVAVVDGDAVVRWGVVSGNWRADLPERALLQAAYRAR
jgi:peroxiredoxin